METESTLTPTSPEPVEPQSYTAFCQKCNKTFTKPTRAAAERATLMHTQRAHNGMKAWTHGSRKASSLKRDNVRKGMSTLSRYTEPERVAMVKAWLSSGLSTVEYIAKAKLPSHIHAWTLRDWRVRYNVPWGAASHLGRARKSAKPASNGSHIPEPAPEKSEISHISMPNYCPECGFNLRTFVMAFTVAKAR